MEVCYSWKGVKVVKQMFLKSMLIVTLGCACSTGVLDVNAAYYTNGNGVEMNEAEYEKMVTIFSEDRIPYLTQGDFDKYKNKQIDDSDAIFTKVTYNDDGEVICEDEISEEEYNNAKKVENSCSPLSDTFDSFETTYKRFAAQLFTDNSITAIVNWLKVPYTRSYDVFAMRYQYFNYTNVRGAQDYYSNNTRTRITYDSSSQNYKAQSTGWGMSMNLKDDSNITGFDMIMDVQLSVQNTTSTKAHAYITYQHAQADVTRAQSMSYSIGIGGLGNVLRYSDSNIESRYDDMSGIHLVRDL